MRRPENRNRTAPRLFHRRGWGYLATACTCPSDLAATQVIAGPLDDFKNEGSICFLKIG